MVTQLVSPLRRDHSGTHLHSPTTSQSHGMFELKRTPGPLVGEDSEAMEIKGLSSGHLGNAHPPSTKEGGDRIHLGFFRRTSMTSTCQSLVKAKNRVFFLPEGSPYSGPILCLLSAACTSPSFPDGQGHHLLLELIIQRNHSHCAQRN